MEIYIFPSNPMFLSWYNTFKLSSNENHSERQQKKTLNYSKAIKISLEKKLSNQGNLGESILLYLLFSHFLINLHIGRYRIFIIIRFTYKCSHISNADLYMFFSLVLQLPTSQISPVGDGALRESFQDRGGILRRSLQVPQSRNWPTRSHQEVRRDRRRPSYKENCYERNTNAKGDFLFRTSFYFSIYQHHQYRVIKKDWRNFKRLHCILQCWKKV